MAEIAAYYGISHQHLRKVVHRLSGLKYIKTYAGKNGGMELNKPADKINIGRLFREFEGVNPLIDCDKSQCPLRVSCGLNSLFMKAQDAFMKEIKQYSLADVLDNAVMVKTLLNP